MYHLKSLISGGYVIKTESIYTLTPKGLTYVDSLSSDNLKPRKQPKLIAIIAVNDKFGKYLLLERKFQPYKDALMLPSGKQHFGEDIYVHAKRELKEKTGLNIPLTYRGVANISLGENNQTLTHVVAHVHSGTIDEILLPAENDRFKFVLHDFKTKNKNLMPGTYEIYKLINSEQPNFITNLSFLD
jgi:ADP-ribose pyrophosphatase YjhB (NUDIX family)